MTFTFCVSQPAGTAFKRPDHVNYYVIMPHTNDLREVDKLTGTPRLPRITSIDILLTDWEIIA